MWDNPIALTRLTRVLIAATLLFSVYLVGRQVAEIALPFSRVEVLGANRAETREAVPHVINRLQGGFFSLDLEGARNAFELLPWVREAAVRRVWPGTLVIELTEHVPAAAWNELSILNTRGEVFAVRPWAGLPKVSAPEGSEREVASRMGDFSQMLKPAGWEIAALRVDARQAWQVALKPAKAATGDAPSDVRADKTVVIELGRERLSERVKRFVVFFPQVEVLAQGDQRVQSVDMRYPNGFAVRGGELNKAAAEKVSLGNAGRSVNKT